ncbi:hypothetical protein BMF94_3287 [Rhodotorula taiwanensis]|uniref:Bud22 domain-containing protein n=1 Tax=Rhodotorula taiwanensis TaxID=741276 RepID=A0A2S5BAF7_9BASI|nr:hypothetical protein BMF94_3287 [Rhodotorula taiwanensis]
MSSKPAQKRSRPSDQPGKQVRLSLSRCGHAVDSSRLVDSQAKRWKGAADATAEVDPQAQEQALKAYMHHALKLLHKAVKKSKTFEVQKLTRKVKQTKEPKDGKVDEKAVDDLDAQLSALKKLDLNSIPPHVLKTRIAKFGPLRSHLSLPSLLSAIPVPSSSKWVEYAPSSAESKARNRILANKAVGEAWDEISRAVRKRLGEEVEPAKGAKGKGKEEEKKKGITMDPGRQAAIEAAFLNGGSDEGEAQEDGGADGEEADEETSEDEGPAEGFSSGPEDEGDSDADEDEAIQRELAALGGSGSEGDWSGSEEDEDDEVEAVPPTTKRRKLSLSPPPPPASKKAKTAAPSKPITSSSFLPSLAAGYISYSDSDGEEARWIKDGERKEQQGEKRKNRRGQRARQAIWEKKFGSAAAHVVKANGGKPVPLAKVKQQKTQRAERQRANPSTKSTGPLSTSGSFAPSYDNDGPATAAAAPPRRDRHSFHEPQADPGWKKREEVKKQAEEAEKVHPSWEAKRKAAEALKQSAALKPQGKKITFD